jgi:hypothetical protein
MVTSYLHMGTTYSLYMFVNLTCSHVGMFMDCMGTHWKYVRLVWVHIGNLQYPYGNVLVNMVQRQWECDTNVMGNHQELDMDT